MLLLAGPASAQHYQRLHVRSFTLTSDKSNPQLEEPFHVTLTIRVAENVSHLENVFLPTFFGAEELGDEQQIAAGAGGTTYRETLTLVAHERGMLAVSSAYLDAIDARDGKAKRFISNPLKIPVGGGPVSVVWNVLRTVVYVAIEIAVAAAALFVLATIFWRRRDRTPVTTAPQPQPAPAPAVSDPARELAAAFARLRERRDRPAVLALRGALWHAAGANAGETLSDVLRRPAADEHLRRLLMVVERATFIEEARLDEAIEDVLAEREWTYA
jgi:hypothetical protein